LDGRLARLAKAIDKFVAEHKKDQMKSFVVLLDENTQDNQKQLTAFAAKHALSIPLTIAIDGKPGPRAYKLNPDVPITILATRRNSVRNQFALTDPGPSDAEAQAKEVAAILAAAQELLK
jgi:hypothetical protein